MSKHTLNSGIDFELGKSKLIYDKNGFPRAEDWIKTFEAGKYAYANSATGPDVLYGGTRYMEAAADEPTLKDYDYMCDVTFLNAGFVGDEYIKTVGHYHGDVTGRTVAYPEIYEPLSDGIEYLLQSEPDEDGYIDTIWVLSEPGDKVFMLPNFGHVSINVSDKPVVEVDVQKRYNPDNSIYCMYKEKIGGAIYRTKDGLAKNPHYNIKSLRIMRPKEKPELGLTRGTPLYTSLVKNPEKFRFIDRPQDYSFAVDEFFSEVTPPFAVFKV